MKMNYSKGKIYKIVCNDTNQIYIGSTITPLIIRLAEHLNGYRKWLRNPHKYRYISVFPILEKCNFKIELIEEFPCMSDQELKKRERYWFDKIPSINLIRPYRTHLERKQYQSDWFKSNYEISWSKCFWRLFETEEEKQYKQDLQKEQKRQSDAAYRSKENNKIKHQEYDKKHYEQNKEKYIENARKQREKDPEKKKQYDKERYENNKELFSQKAKDAYQKRKANGYYDKKKER